MSTSNPTEFDYQRHMRETLPDTDQMVHGTQPRKQRREVAKQRITIRIDQEVLDEFKLLAPEGRGYQSLINQALREWLDAQGVKELLRQDLPDLVGQVLSSQRD